MAKRAYELLVRFGKDETVAGAHVKEMHLDDDGNDLRETAPIPLADTNNPAFNAFKDQFAAAALAENESLKTQLAEANARIATLLEAVRTIRES